MNSSFSAIREKGLDVLTKELGPSGAAIFIRQFDSGSGDYTEEREDLLQGVTIDDVAASIKKRKERAARMEE